MAKCDNCYQVRKVRSYPRVIKIVNADGIKIPSRLCDRCSKR